MEQRTSEGSLPESEKYGAWSIDQLIEDLDSPKSLTRVKAAQALGELRSPKAVDPLIIKLNHIDKHTKIAVATALGNIGDKRAIRPLVTAMRRESSDTLEAMQSALVKLEASDVLAREKTARKFRKTLSSTTKPGVLRMFIGGAIIIFSVLALLVDFLLSDGVINFYCIVPMLIGISIFVRGFIKNSTY
jgi:hypothetical protein